MMYKVFTRTWWRPNKTWPNGLEPAFGRKTTIRKGIKTAEEARRLCDQINNSITGKNRLGRRAEFESY